MTVTISLAVRNAMLNAVIAYIKGSSAAIPYVDIRDGVPPAITAGTTGTPMADIRFPGPAGTAPFPASTTGSVSQNNFTADTTTAAGTPTYFRLMSGDAAPGLVVLQGTVGDQQDDDLIFTNIIWQLNGTADITSMQLTVPVSCA